MLPIKKRIYISVGLLAVVIIFNILGYYYIRQRTKQNGELQQGLLLATNIQATSQEVAQGILVLTIHQSFSEDVIRQKMDQLNLMTELFQSDFRLLNAIVRKKILSNDNGRDDISKLIDSTSANLSELINYAKMISLDSANNYANDYSLAGRVRSHEASLRKQLLSLTLEMQKMEIRNSALISAMNGAIIISLFITLLFIGVFLIIPTIRLNLQNQQLLQQSLKETQRSEAMLRTVIDLSPDFIFILDRDQKYKMVNKTLANTLSLRTQDLLEKNDLELGLSAEMILGNLEKGIRGLWNDNRQVIETGESKRVPEETLYLNGKLKVVSMTKTPLKDDNGNIWGLLGFAHDITESIEARKRIEESEKKYRHLFYNNPVPMWIYDPATARFLEINEMAMLHYGYSQEEFLNMSIFDIRPEEEKLQLMNALQENRQMNTYTIRTGFIHQKKNGEKIHVDIISHKIIYNSKPAVLVLSKDVTNEIALQNELMEEKINRQKEVTRATIDSQEKEREYIGRELHDNVNQILTSAKLYLQSAVNGETAKHLSSGIHLIGTAIQEIRKLSKLFVPPTIPQTGLIASIEDLLENIGSTQKIEIDFEHLAFNEQLFDNDLKLTLYRIIQEQTTNIIKYADASKIKIELCKSKNKLYLTIADNGKGFDPKQYRKGIGITNMMNRTEIYHGKLEIEASPGSGCRLSVEFDLKNFSTPHLYSGAPQKKAV